MVEYEFWKQNKTSKIWHVSIGDTGSLLFSFDGKTVFNFWSDYPHKLTKEQKDLFDKEFPVIAALKR